jgi:hypothetical protein
MTTLTPTAPRRSARAFARHYLEMVMAMVLGMVVLGVPAAALLGLFGVTTAELHDDAPAVALLGMAVTMTVPMVAWMRHRGHGWRASNEMAASMFIPTFAVVGLLAAGIVSDFGAAMGLEHLAMLPAMLVAMLLRLDEYAAGHHHAATAQQVLVRQEVPA